MMESLGTGTRHKTTHRTPYRTPDTAALPYSLVCSPTMLGTGHMHAAAEGSTEFGDHSFLPVDSTSEPLCAVGNKGQTGQDWGCGASGGGDVARVAA